MSVFLLAAAAAVSAPPPAQPSIAAAPMGEQVLRYYPALAQAAEIAGRVVLSCTAKPDGAVTDCRVTSEAPADWGFASAALNLAPYFHMGQPSGSAERRVTIPIVFRLSGLPNELTPYRCYGALADSPDPKAAQYARGLALMLKDTAAKDGASAAEADGLLARARRETTGAEKAALAARCADGL